MYFVQAHFTTDDNEQRQAAINQIMDQAANCTTLCFHYDGDMSCDEWFDDGQLDQISAHVMPHNLGQFIVLLTRPEIHKITTEQFVADESTTPPH